jgi:N-alpha-acetyltransferase 35, NatC auxiliary subunit
MIVLGTMSIRQVLDEDLANFVLPASMLLDRDNDEIEVPTDPRFNIASRIEIFRSRAAGTYLDILRTMCQNRCRIRRTLCHTIVDWDNLQLDAEEIDQELREFTKEEPIMEPNVSREPIYAFPLSSWSYFYKLRQMEWVVQMGFELEMYQPDELATMYWYVQYLSRTRVRHLERIRTFVSRTISTRNSQDQGIGTAGGLECVNALAFNSLSTLEASAKSAFADALSCLFTVLNRLALLTKLPRPYSDDQMRYEVRMKPFLSIGLPELIPFPELTNLVKQPNDTTMDLLNFAAESTAAAKRALEALAKLNAEQAFCHGSHDSWVKDVKDALKACIFTNITIAAVKRGLEAAGEDGKVELKVEIPQPSTRYHVWWIVPKVVPVS